MSVLFEVDLDIFPKRGLCCLPYQSCSLSDILLFTLLLPFFWSIFSNNFLTTLFFFFGFVLFCFHATRSNGAQFVLQICCYNLCGTVVSK